MRDRPSDAHTKVIPAGPGQVRDHIDEDKTNNAKSNLRPMDRGAHTAMHNRGRSVSRLKRALSMPARKERLY